MLCELVCKFICLPGQLLFKQPTINLKFCAHASTEIHKLLVIKDIVYNKSANDNLCNHLQFDQSTERELATS